MNTLKEQEGRYYQECEVVMLATDQNPTPISIGNTSKIMDYHQFLFGKKEGIYNNHTFQNLYFLSNEITDVDNIKEGEWLINPYGYPEQFGFDWQAQWSKEEILKCKKILVTTDKTLQKDTEITTPLPKPSDSFIQKYIEEYNRGNQITKVLIEYENPKIVDYNKQGLKVDSDDTITIKIVKDSYSREELFPILEAVLDLGMTVRQDQLNGYETKSGKEKLNNWIKENL